MNGRTAVQENLKAREAAAAPVASAGTTIGLCLAAIAVIALADILTAKVNLAILFSFPLIVLSHRLRRPGALIGLAAGLCVLSAADYLLKIWLLESAHPKLADAMLSYRLFNRTMVILTIICVTVLTIYIQRLGDRFDRVRELHRDPATGDEYEKVLIVLEQLAWGVVCVLLTVTIFVMDVITPARLNPPILYVLPVFISIRLTTRKMLWVLVLAALLGNLGGHFFGPPELLDAALAQKIAINRCVAAAVVVLVAGTLSHRWPRSVATRGPGPGK
jgi:hypothetical protein